MGSVARRRLRSAAGRSAARRSTGGAAGRARAQPAGDRPSPPRSDTCLAAHARASRARPSRCVATDRRGSWRRRACVAAVVVTAANRPDGFVRVTVLDVGQGDAILVEGGRGGRLLVDGGPDPDRLLVALDGRLPPWDRRIDARPDHPHEDHVAGLALLLDRYRVGRTLEPGMIGPGPGYRAWAAGIQRSGRRRAGWRPVIGWASTRSRSRSCGRSGPVPREPADGGTAINNVSIVLLGEVGRQRFLLAGDIEEDIDPILLAGACLESTS